ncbi:MAG: outer membrane beta-barrel protein [Terriglobales bacterium]
MRKFTWILALSLFLALPARGQDTPQVELFGGGGFARADVGGADLNLYGWNGAVTENVNKWLGGTADFSGFYGHQTTLGPGLTPVDVNVSAHTFMFGPHFAYRKAGAFTPFAHVLLGGIRASQGYVGISQDATRFAAAFGGGIDIKVHKHVAVRVFQAEYVVTPFLGLRQDNIRLTAGIVLRFGKR